MGLTQDKIASGYLSAVRYVGLVGTLGLFLPWAERGPDGRGGSGNVLAMRPEILVLDGPTCGPGGEGRSSVMQGC
jgi:hypothetical protein